VVDLAEPRSRASGEGPSQRARSTEIYQTFRKVIAAAVDDDRIPKLLYPAHPPMARSKPKPVRFLTEGVVSTLAGAIAPRYEAAVYLLAYGGFRIGDLAALRMEDVDWERACIHVRRGLTDVGGIIASGNMKTARSFRSVPMADLNLPEGRTMPGFVTRRSF
jgi:integrase